MGTLQELEIVYRSRLRMISISKGKRDRGGAGAFAERELCQHHRTPRPPAAFLGSRAGFALAGVIIICFLQSACAQGTRRRRLHLWGVCDPGCAATRGLGCPSVGWPPDQQTTPAAAQPGGGWQQRRHPVILGDSTGGLYPAPERRTRGSEHLQACVLRAHAC